MFYQFVMERVVWGPNYPFFAVQSHQRAVEYINVHDVMAFCPYLLKKKKAVDSYYLLFLCVSNTITTIGWWWMRRENNKIVVVVVVVDNHACALSCADVFCVLRS